MSASRPVPSGSVRIAICGSIATDHLMTFDGRFADSLVVVQLDKISVSFLASDLQIRRGGIAANIAFGMAHLGQRPVLVGSVGEDFADYRSWLERHGVDCESVHVSETLHTARFVCTTDNDMAQMATFYAGAMAEARNIELGPIAARVGGLDLVLIGADDPEAMLRHTEECRARGIPFVADPSQQLAFADGPSSANSSTAPTTVLPVRIAPTRTRPAGPEKSPAGHHAGHHQGGRRHDPARDRSRYVDVAAGVARRLTGVGDAFRRVHRPGQPAAPSVRRIQLGARRLASDRRHPGYRVSRTTSCADHRQLRTGVRRRDRPPALSRP